MERVFQVEQFKLPGKLASYPTAMLRMVTLDEDDGSQTKWILVGWQEGAGDAGYYTRLFLMRGADVKEDITMPVLEFNMCMNDPDHWPLVELAVIAVGVGGPLWAGRGSPTRPLPPPARR